MTPATAIRLSTLAIILVMVVLHTRSFLKAGKDPKILIPSLGGTIAGASLAICVGGALGTVATYIAGSGNVVSGVVPWATGTGDRALASGSPQGLTMEGGLIALAAAALTWVVIREAAKTQRIRLIGGLFCGTCLTYTAGIGGLVGNTIVPAYNGIGAQIASLAENLV